LTTLFGDVGLEKSVPPQGEGYVVVRPKALSMKKLAVLFLVALIPINSFAETMFLTASLNAAGSLLTGIYAAPSVELAEQSGLWGFGFQVRSLVGFQFGDVYLVSCFLLKIGRVDLGLGASVLLLPPVVVYAGSSPGALNPVFSIAATSDPLLGLGPGTLRFDISVDFIATAIQQSSPSPLSGLNDALNAIRSAFKLTLGFAYVYGF